MEGARLVKIFALVLFLMVIIMPVKAGATDDEDQELGELLIELLLMAKVCDDYLHSTPEGVCDTTTKLEHYRLSFNPLLFVSGDMREDSGEITVRSPQGSSLRAKLSFTREGKLYRHTRDGKVELSPKEFESPIDKAGRTRAIRNLSDAFTACKAYLADNPQSVCDSLEVLEEKGFKLGNLIRLVEADMGSSAGSITLESRITERSYEIDHAGKVSEAELSDL